MRRGSRHGDEHHRDRQRVHGLFGRRYSRRGRNLRSDQLNRRRQSGQHAHRRLLRHRLDLRLQYHRQLHTTVVGGAANEVHFNITTALVGGAHTIQVGNAIDGSNGILPAITRSIVIDGSTQSDFDGTPVIALDGQFATASDENGLTLETSNSTIRGLIINRFGDDATQICSY